MNNETLEEAVERIYPIKSSGGAMEMSNRHQLNNFYKQEGFINGAKWMQERMYSEEEVIELLKKKCLRFEKNIASPFRELLLKQDLEWFEQNKKK